MKSTRNMVMIALGLLVLASVIYLGYVRPAKTVNVNQLTAALRTYAIDHANRGMPLPASVSLQELISRGLLRSEDVVAFGKANDVRVMLTTNKETNPNEVVIEATLPDGNRVGALMDGSVVQLPK